MTEKHKSLGDLMNENVRLRAQVAQLEDRFDHLSEHGASKTLQQQEALYANVLNAVSDVVLIADDTGRITYVSPNAKLVFGLSPAELLKQGRISFVLPANLYDPDALEQRGEIANVECQIRDPIGRPRDLSITVRRIDRDGGVLFACRDVSERKKLTLDLELAAMTLDRRVEERTAELRASRERFRRYVEGLRGEYLFYATDQEGVITYVSPSVHSVLGFKPSEVIGRNWREFINVENPHSARLEEYEQMRLLGLQPPASLTAPVRRVDGRTIIIEFTDMQIRDADGCVVMNEGVCRDITQRLANEEALRRQQEDLEKRVAERTAELTAANEKLSESELRYRTVIEDQLDFIVRWKRDGSRTFVNDAYCRYWDASPVELVGGSFFQDFSEPDRDGLRTKLAAATVANPVVHEQHRVVTPDGRTAWQQWTHRALFNSAGMLIEYQSVGADVTDRHRREEQSREQVVARAHLQALSERERDVMRLVVAGDANKVIARRLNLSVKTIEKHRSSLMKKLHVRSVPELVRLALLAEGTGGQS
jgi:PAS domain S-box-containing protein